MNEDLKKAFEKRAALKRIKEAQAKLKLDKLKIQYGFKTDEQIKREIQDQYEKDFRSYPIEMKQKFLDLVHSGKTVGESYREAGISFECACEVMKRAIKETSYLAKEIKE